LALGTACAGYAWWVLSGVLDDVSIRRLAAAWGAVSAAALVASVLRTHRSAHVREALRLGCRVRRGWGLWPVQWWSKGIPLAVEPADQGGSLSPLDRSLIEIAGPWANIRLLGQHLTRRSFVLEAFLMLLLHLAAGRWTAEESGSYRYGDLVADDFRHWPFLCPEEQRLAHPCREAVRRTVRRVCRSAGGVRPGSRVLELGAGGGTLWSFLPEALRGDWISLDRDPVALRWGRTVGRSPRAVCGDVLRLPFPAASFDAVAGLTLFDSIKPGVLEGALRECRRVLRPGGRLLHLQDFPDWPAPELALQMNILLARLPGVSGKVLNEGGELRFLVHGRGDIEGHAARLAAILPWDAGDRLAFLSRAVTDPEFAFRFRRGPRAFLWILDRAFQRAGFVTVSGLEEPAEDPPQLHHLAASRPEGGSLVFRAAASASRPPDEDG
jgi:SAM-dependent methyltransferase